MRVRIVKVGVGQISAKMPSTPANTPRSMKAHQISPSLALTRLCIPAARDPRGSFRSFIVYFLAKHPLLTRYTLCLPLDRQDPGIENQRWFTPAPFGLVIIPFVH